MLRTCNVPRLIVPYPNTLAWLLEVLLCSACIPMSSPQRYRCITCCWECSVQLHALICWNGIFYKCLLQHNLLALQAHQF